MTATVCLRDAIRQLIAQGRLRVSQTRAFEVLAENHLIRKTRHGYQTVAPAAMADTLKDHETMIPLETDTGTIPKYTTSVHIYTSEIDWLCKFINNKARQGRENAA